MRLISVFGLVLFPALVVAHHSRTQYAGDVREIQGELVSVAWANPHAAFGISVVNESGDSEIWYLESWGSPYVLSRMGVMKDDFVVGSHVRMAGRPSNIVANRLLLTNMLRDDGTEIVLAADGEAYWNNAQVGGRAQWRDDRIATTAEENRGIFRVWSVERMGEARRTRVLTERAAEIQKTFDPRNSFIVNCEPQGMPTAMNYVHPIEFIDAGDGIIVLRHEYLNLERTIHLEPAGNPEAQPFSLLGYSVGHWEDEGRSLVITTTRIDWPYSDTRGSPLTRAAEITERFTVSDNQETLTYRMTIDDPETFVEPATHESIHIARGETFGRSDCAPDL